MRKIILTIMLLAFSLNAFSLTENIIFSSTKDYTSAIIKQAKDDGAQIITTHITLTYNPEYGEAAAAAKTVERGIAVYQYLSVLKDISFHGKTVDGSYVKYSQPFTLPMPAKSFSGIIVDISDGVYPIRQCDLSTSKINEINNSSDPVNVDPFDSSSCKTKE